MVRRLRRYNPFTCAIPYPGSDEADYGGSTYSTCRASRPGDAGPPSAGGWPTLDLVPSPESGAETVMGVFSSARGAKYLQVLHGIATLEMNYDAPRRWMIFFPQLGLSRCIGAVYTKPQILHGAATVGIPD